MRKPLEENDQTEVTVSAAPVDPDFSKSARAIWARLIQKVYEVDPMFFPHYGDAMRLMALIENPPVIEKILKHLHHWDPRPPGQAPPTEDLEWPDNSHNSTGSGIGRTLVRPKGSRQGGCESHPSELCAISGHRLSIQACPAAIIRLYSFGMTPLECHAWKNDRNDHGRKCTMAATHNRTYVK